MNILFTVCGRAGSKGIKGKNFKEFLGIPLLYYTFAAILLYKENHGEYTIDVALNTDSQEMIDMVRRNKKINALIVPRKTELASDQAAKKPVIADTLLEAERVRDVKYDLVVDCDITSPLRTVADIEAVVNKAAAFDYDVVFSVVDARRNPYFNMVKENLDDTVSLVMPSKYTARQQAPVIYDMNASIYAYKPQFLHMNKTIFDGKCGIVKMLDTAVLDLDHEYDFELMQVIARYKIDEVKDEALCEVFSKVGEILKQTNNKIEKKLPGTYRSHCQD